jgi:hypothetical protein
MNAGASVGIYYRRNYGDTSSEQAFRGKITNQPTAALARRDRRDKLLSLQ